MAFLNIQGIQKIFGQTHILKNINLHIEEGEFLVLVGPSGCGKSTLLSLIAGLEPVSEGQILINQKDVTQLHPSKRDIAMVFQSYALYPNMTVQENITFSLEMRGVSKSERDNAVKEVANTLQIQNLLKRKPSQLSGGQRQRVAMGRAIVRKPLVYLFDEPLSNLDAKLRVDMRTEMKRLHQNLKTTTIYVTHDQIEALTLATRIVLMKDGVIQQVGTPNEVYNDPNNLFVAGFMGSPSMNFIPVHLEKKQDFTQMTIKNSQDAPFIFPHHLANFSKSGDAILGIRPEHITLDNNPQKANLVKRNCNIDLVEMAGSDSFVFFSLGDTEVVAKQPSDIDVQTGDQEQLTFNLNKAVLFDSQSGERLR